MLKHYFIIAFRSLLKNKTNSFINIFGLAVGMTVFLLITMYCINELGYNKFHKNYKSIYQVEIGDGFYTSAPLGTMIKNKFPDIGTIVRVDNSMGGGTSPILEVSSGSTDKKIKVENVLFADPAFFDIFSFPMILGNLNTALKEPYSVVLTQTTAHNLFGEENAVGQTIHYIGDRNGQPEMDLKVTAVVKDVPNNSTISFSAVGSLSTLNAFAKKYGYNIDEDWRNCMYSTFIKPAQNNIGGFAGRINKQWMEQERILDNKHEQFNLVPFDEVYFHNNNKRQFILFLQLIGIFILAIAVINFINLTIAKSASRAKEIGMRKVSGANRSAIIKQILGESIFLNLLALSAALAMVELIKPYYFKIIDKQIHLNLLNQPAAVLILIAVIVLIGIISGIYPAIFFSVVKPTSILKGEMAKGKRGNPLRYILIVFQFVVSIALIICTLLISKQVNYLKTKDLGFNNKNIIHFNQSEQVNKYYETFKQKLLKNPDILCVSRSNTSFGQELPITTSQELHGLKKSYCATTVDPDFIPTMGIQVIEGRPFSWNIAGDFQGAAIVNETFIKEFELKDALGKEINFMQWKFKIIGVMKDFHYNSLHQKVEPSALINVNWNAQINIRIKNYNISRSIQYIKDTWNEFSPDSPFEFEFLDKTYDKLYKSDEQFQSIINSFSVIAIFIACLGLLGLVSINIDKRIKEIGIRKILGASVSSIVFTLTGEYLKWIVLANIIAWPAAYYFMNKWLQNFAYRIDINWWVFFLAGGIALVIALATISVRAIKAATVNPVESLKYE